MSTTTNLAQAALNALGNPDGYVASLLYVNCIGCPRTLETNGHSATLTAMVHLRDGDEQNAQSLLSLMAVNVDVADEKLAMAIGKKAGLLTVTDCDGLTFIDDTPENKAVLAELRAKCRFATAEEVAA